MTLAATPKLGLYKADGTDAFLRTKFNETWDKLDTTPGILPCTSSTRPVGWTAAMAGRTIFETDTYKYLAWSGTTWIDPEFAPHSWHNSAYTNDLISPGITGSYTTMICTVLRPGRFQGFITYQILFENYNQNAYQNPIINNVDVSMGTGQTMRPGSTIGAATTDSRMGISPFSIAVTPGVYTVVLKTAASSANNGTYNMWSYQALAWMGQP